MMIFDNDFDDDDDVTMMLKNMMMLMMHVHIIILHHHHEVLHHNISQYLMNTIFLLTICSSFSSLSQSSECILSGQRSADDRVRLLQRRQQHSGAGAGDVRGARRRGRPQAAGPRAVLCAQQTR